ncbi:hypothetical protein, conserved [Babesia bigemina]|uniref:C3H1-type domain-containing protein n=1 Tax=Babesia bigemina TaxID=5866 RepID=A0A061BLZ9_BABBI|nr:hypothetical protein, conserved [Babesia bigemina]CDR71901.1 hypothetical protein, conserved [Babesia bigemina]|eukprot:XP_012770843.1 hypothetical protein, conserved [Babesia bigemina]
MLISLGHLAAQLGAFVGESDSVKKAVKNAIKACFDTNPDLKTDLNDVYDSHVTTLSVSVNSADQAGENQKISELKDKVTSQIAVISEQVNTLNNPLNPSPSSPSPSADSAKLQSKLEVLEKVEKLCGFYENSKNASNDPKNLLDNLCDGLQTFLGYDKDSKGYDGSGIVYSDLDRLCDAVMGFLSGVLSNIKEHLGQHKNSLDDAINILNANKHGGKKGFNDAIVKVVEGVGRYNKGVEQSNTSIRNPIRTLLKYVKAEKGTLLDGLNAIIQVPDDAAHDAVEQAETQVRDKLTECQQAADTFNTAFNLKTQTDMNKCITDLNDKIETKVRHSIGNVKHESERLKALAQKERSDLDATIKVTTDTLENLRSGVRKNVCERVTTLVSDLKNIVTLILKELRAMNLKLEWLVKELKQWMEEAKKIIKETLRKQVEEIRREIDEDAGSKNPNHKKSLLAEITKLETALGTKVSELEKWKEAGDAAVRLAKEKCDEIVGKLNGGDTEKDVGTKGGVKDAAEQLKSKAEELRGKALATKQKVAELVREALTAVKRMDDALKQDLWKVKQEIKNAVKALGIKLEGDVKEDLTTLKGAISGPLSIITSGAVEFLEKLRATHRAIQAAVENIYDNVNKVRELQNLNSIEGSLDSKIKLLPAMRTENAFTRLTTYFEHLDQHIMQKVEDSMRRIGSVMLERVALYAGGVNLDYELGKSPIKDGISEALESLAKVSNLKTLPNLADLKSILGNTEWEDLQTVLTGISSVKDKITGKTADKMTKEDVESLLTYFSSMAQAISSHSDKLVKAVMAAIQKKVKEEIGEVAGAINAKVGHIRTGVQKDTENDGNENYGLSHDQPNSRGLQALVTQFEKINQKLEELKNTTIPNTIFKTSGVGDNNYDLKTVMSNFHTTYEKNFKEGDIKTGGGTGTKSVLDEEIGGDGTTTVGAAQKISNLATGKFTNYEQQVKQDSLTSGDPNKLEGELPKAIKAIETTVNGKDCLQNVNNGRGGGDGTFDGQMFETLNQKITTNLNSFTDKVKDLVKDGGSNNDVNAYLEDVSLLLNTGDPVTLKSDIKGSHNGVKGLVTIKEDIHNLQTTNIKDVKDYLKYMCGYVRNHTKDIDAQLNNLADNLIDKQLKDLHDQLHTLQSKTLDKIIKATETFINTDTKVLQERCIDELYEYLDRQVGDVKQQLSTHARRQYVSSIDALLKAFAKKTESELKPLLIDVNSDLNIGLKGFMKKFDEKFVGGIKALGAIDATSFTVQGLRKIHPMSQAADKFNTCLKASLEYLEKQKDLTSDYKIITPAKEALRKVLAKLVQSQHFDHEFCNNLDALTDELDKLAPGKFGQPTTVLSQAFKEGFADLASVLGKAYVNMYDGASDGFLWTNAAKDHKLTDDAVKCAKVCWSVLPILHSGLTHLRDQCSKNYPASQIHLTSGPGVLLTHMGYDVAKGRTSQDGQLRNMETMMGEKIARLLAKNISGNDNEHLNERITKNIGTFNLFNVLECLYTHLNDYYSVRHLVLNPRPRMPCNIYEMLCWMSGLPCNNVFDEMLHEAVSELFVDPEKQVTDGELSAAVISDEPIAAYPHDINYNPLLTALTDICSQSHDILTTILGTGDSYTIYAVDYSTNSLGLRYPSTGEDCLQMLLDILRRLFPVLRFMYAQCGLSAAYRGWYDCQYGKNVKYSNWNCREHSAKQQLDCYPTSPLMSYLRDCLPGLLPHRLTNIGCKSVCANCPKKLPGQPCLTPLGFRSFSGSTRTGKELCNVLAKFFDNSYITSLFSLTPKPPSTLSEHFEFALSLAQCISTPTSNHNNGVTELREAFEENITSNSIALYKVPSKLTDALLKSYCNREIAHSAKHSDAKNTDLSSLARENSCSDLYSQCAPYLCSTSSDAYTYLAKKHADLYLSWAVYLPWTFYSYLKGLLDAFQQIDCGGSGCTKCSCKPGKHGVEYSCKCNALISCRGVMTTFYQYGFTFGNAKTLYGTNRKFCLSFHTQLSNLLKSQYFTKLFEECDNFIWTIREPFTYLVLALWSASFLYLICVMVGRLDVLHIRSHLRIPSSHRITAQSLLAAAQVGRLAKISYLQP